MVKRIAVAAVAVLALAACGSDPEPVPQKVIIVQPETTVPAYDDPECSQVLVDSAVSTYLSLNPDGLDTLRLGIKMFGLDGTKEKFMEGFLSGSGMTRECGEKMWDELLRRVGAI